LLEEITAYKKKESAFVVCTYDISQYPTMRGNCSTYVDLSRSMFGREFHALLGNLIPNHAPARTCLAHEIDNFFPEIHYVIAIHISSGIADYLSKVNYANWIINDCLKFLDENNCPGISSNRKARDKVTKLYKNAERNFKFKEIVAFFVRMDEKANINIFDAKTNLYGSEVAVQMISDKLTDFQYTTSSLKRNNEEANTRNQKDSTFELLTKESLNTDEDLIIGNFNARESLMNWKWKNNPLRDDFATVSLIMTLDLNPGTNSDFVKSYLSPEVYNKLITHEPTIQERDYNEIKAFIHKMIKVTDFKKSIVEHYLLARNDDEKEILWNYVNLLAHSFERDNDLLNEALSERMYREMFLTPLITNLFQKKFKNMEIYLQDHYIDIK
ncbi:3979_t:CDS:10, partial [Cetraspora pellucida]